ncbi:MAG: hypothetical protein ACRDTC_09135 [Pseudonocardiaceae bacterium]
MENVEGGITIARNVHWRAPAPVREAIESPIVHERLTVLKGFAYLRRKGNDLVQTEVINQIRHLIDDDSKMVSAAALELMTALAPDRKELVAYERSPPLADEPALDTGCPAGTAPRWNRKGVAWLPVPSIPLATMTATSGQASPEPKASRSPHS